MLAGCRRAPRAIEEAADEGGNQERSASEHKRGLVKIRVRAVVPSRQPTRGLNDPGGGDLIARVHGRCRARYMPMMW